MPKPTGRTLSLSPSRRILGDLLRLARRIPAVPIERTMHLSALAAALRSAAAHPSWPALMVKAFGLVSAHNPLLRRCYVPWPRPHLHESPVGVASVPVSRIHEGEETLFYVQLSQPEAIPLREIDAVLRRHRDESAEELAAFRRVEWWARWPGFARRLIWRVGLGWSGRFHTAMFGTFVLSPFAGLGVDSVHPLSMLAPTLNHGPVAEDGTIEMRLVYDHRVMDGVGAAQVLTQIERALNGAIAEEVRRLAPGEEAA